MSRCGRRWAIAMLCCAAAACGSDRPTSSEWADDWVSARTLVPTADELTAGGQPLCDELLGRMRERLTQLEPAPTASLDDVVGSWVGSAESLAFDCPQGDELERRLAELDALRAEIDAGLAAIDR